MILDMLTIITITKKLTEGIGCSQLSRRSKAGRADKAHDIAVNVAIG